MIDKPAKQIFDEMFEKIKRLEKYEIKREVGPGWLPRGTIPFGIKVKNGIATFTVYAKNQIDANDQVSRWLEDIELDDEE
jgi:hypothetical protein